MRTRHVSSSSIYFVPLSPHSLCPQTLSNCRDRRPLLWAACGLQQSSLGLAWAQSTWGPGWAAGSGLLHLMPASTCGWAWSRRQAKSTEPQRPHLPDGAVSCYTQCALCRFTACGALEGTKHAGLSFRRTGCLRQGLGPCCQRIKYAEGTGCGKQPLSKVPEHDQSPVPLLRLQAGVAMGLAKTTAAKFPVDWAADFTTLMVR